MHTEAIATIQLQSLWAVQCIATFRVEGVHDVHFSVSKDLSKCFDRSTNLHHNNIWLYHTYCKSTVIGILFNIHPLQVWMLLLGVVSDTSNDSHFHLSRHLSHSFNRKTTLLALLVMVVTLYHTSCHGCTSYMSSSRLQRISYFLICHGTLNDTHVCLSSALSHI